MELLLSTAPAQPQVWECSRLCSHRTVTCFESNVTVGFSAGKATRSLSDSFLTQVCLCRIKHENIVTLEDIYESTTHFYLVMQL